MMWQIKYFDFCKEKEENIGWKQKFFFFYNNPGFKTGNPLPYRNKTKEKKMQIKLHNIYQSYLLAA